MNTCQRINMLTKFPNIIYRYYLNLNHTVISEQSMIATAMFDHSEVLEESSSCK